MKFSSILLLSTIALVTACSSTSNISQRTGKLDVNVKSDLKADIEVDMQRKLVGQSRHSRLFGFFELQGSKNYADGVGYDSGAQGFSLLSGGIVDDAKSAAAYKATVNKADVLVAPQYHIKVNSWFFGAYKEVTAKVWGYAGKIKNIQDRPAMRSSQLAGN